MARRLVSRRCLFLVLMLFFSLLLFVSLLLWQSPARPTPEEIAAAQCSFAARVMSRMKTETGIVSETDPTWKSEAGKKAAEIKTETVEKPRKSPALSPLQTCWAKKERKCLSPPSALPDNPLFAEKFSAFLARQHQCTHSISDIGAVIRGEESLPNAKCQYLIGRPNSEGLGERMQAVVSTFLFAFLTNRAFLLDDRDLQSLLCEPFFDDGYRGIWRISDHAVSEINNLHNNGPFLDTLFETSSGGGGLTLKKDAATGDELALGLSGEIDSIYLDLAFGYGHLAQNFYCEKVQSVLKKLTFVVILTEQFFVPGLYLIPSFAKELELLFPDHAPFYHVSQYLLNPNNFMWERISRLYETHLKAADVRIGVQVRAHAAKPSRTTKAVLNCLNKVSKALSPPIYSADWNRLWEAHKRGNQSKQWSADDVSRIQKVLANENPKKIVLFISSKHSMHWLDVHRQYQEGVSEDGAIVDVVHFRMYNDTADAKQSKAENLEQEFADVYLLSFCDSLHTTFFATVGYAAAGLQGRPPVLMDVNGGGGYNIERRKYVCVQSKSCEPCFHFPPHQRKCVGAPPKLVEGFDVPELPYLLPCVDTEGGRGRRMWNPDFSIS